MKGYREYSIDHIVRHVDEGSNTRYFVRCHGYTAGDNNMEPSAKIPTDLIRRHWRIKNKAQSKGVTGQI